MAMNDILAELKWEVRKSLCKDDFKIYYATKRRLSEAT